MNLAEERNAKVLKVLQEAREPLGPTGIAARIREPWCMAHFDVHDLPQSSAITPVLKRIGAIRHAKGRWTAPEVKVMGSIGVTEDHYKKALETIRDNARSQLTALAALQGGGDTPGSWEAGARTNAHWTYTEANAALEGLPPYTR